MRQGTVQCERKRHCTLTVNTDRGPTHTEGVLRTDLQRISASLPPVDARARLLQAGAASNSVCVCFQPWVCTRAVPCMLAVFASRVFKGTGPLVVTRIALIEPAACSEGSRKVGFFMLR